MKIIPAFAILIAATAPAIALNAATPPPEFARSTASPATAAALACMVGLVPEECRQMFEKPGAVRISWCAEEYVRRYMDNCYTGALETINYFGTNAAGYDVYDVKNMNAESTYVIPPPGADGRIQAAWFSSGPPPTSYFPSSWYAVKTPVNPVQLIYSRPG